MHPILDVRPAASAAPSPADSPTQAPIPAPAPAREATGPANGTPVETRLKLSELLGALSYALDLTEGQPAGHCLRSGWIGQQVGRALGLRPPQMRDLFYTVLLKDLGCSSTAARISQLYCTDDRAFKYKLRQIDRRALPQALRLLVGVVGQEAPLLQRLRALGRSLTAGQQPGREMVQTRCDRGATIARRLRFSDAVASGIASLDELWNGRGGPQGLRGEAIPLYGRIASLAQFVETFTATRGAEAALREVRRRSGSWFDPALVAAFVQVARDPRFWQRLASPDLETEVFNMDPARELQVVDEDYLDDVAAAFGAVVDAKSPFTGGHSERVGAIAHAVSLRLGLDAAHARWVRRAALLHDVGKLGVSNTILDKPAKLDAVEWRAMQRHAAYTEEVLGRITAFRVMARVAGAHHERLDGQGYPRGLDSRHIRPETRIITVADIFDALTADRPYRGPMPVERALAIMDADVGTAIDAECLAALKAALAAGEI